MKPNELVAIILNLMKIPLFCTDSCYFRCNFGLKEPKLTLKPMKTGKGF